jgi:hypothetical protein
MSAMIYTLAMLQAKRRVKEQIRKEGRKLWEYKARDITVMAGRYCELHKEELVAETKAMIERSAELKKMFEKEQRNGQRAVRNAGNSLHQRGDAEEAPRTQHQP